MQQQQGGTQLRTYALIDRMQPQFAAFMGTMMNGDIPIAGMAQLYVEVAPGNDVYRLADVALKAADVKPGMQMVERQFGVLELHSPTLQAVQAAGQAILEMLGQTEQDRLKGTVVSTQIITNVDPYQAQLINQTRRGSMIVPGEAMLVVEVAPAGYAIVACNEAEKNADIKVVSISSIGPFGRVLLSGSNSQVQTARDAAVRALESIQGRTGI